MPDFVESLQGRDLGHLRIIAQFWGTDLPEQEVQLAILHLKNALVDAPKVDRLISSLGAGEKAALDDLCQHSGRLPWAQFSRTHGELREIGPAKRDRDRIYETPVSAVEALWYRGLLARAFFDTAAGPEEFAYIPDDLLAQFPGNTLGAIQLVGRPASSVEHAQVFPSNDRILDHSCTFLTALRVGLPLPEVYSTHAGEELTTGVLKALMLACGMTDESGNLLSEPVRQFLEAQRGESLQQLFQAWKQSAQFNELRLLPGLVFEGNWENDPVSTRQAVMGWLLRIPRDTWWSLGSFISSIKQHSPDFQRPAGDYDSWFVKDVASNAYLRGFEHWDALDGRLIRYIITGPLHWLGVLDLASREDDLEITAFRLSSWSKALLKGETPKGFALEKEPLAVRSDAHLSIKPLTQRSVRYQLARFCDWEKETPDEYLYRISPASLLRARRHGLKVSQLVTMLNRYAKAVPPSLIKALERWDKQGSEARLEKMVVLRVSSEEVLQALRKSRASRFLGEPLGPATVAIKPGAVDKVLGALAELGYLGEIREDAD